MDETNDQKNTAQLGPLPPLRGTLRGSDNPTFIDDEGNLTNNERLLNENRVSWSTDLANGEPITRPTRTVPLIEDEEKDIKDQDENNTQRSAHGSPSTPKRSAPVVSNGCIPTPRNSYTIQRDEDTDDDTRSVSENTEDEKVVFTSDYLEPQYFGKTDKAAEIKTNAKAEKENDVKKSTVSIRSNANVDTSCGYFSLKPACMQKCHNSKAALAILGAYCFCQSFVITGISSVNTSTLERRFNLPSSKVALIPSSYDIAAGVSVLFVGYFGRTAHKARMLAVGAFFLFLGCLLESLPHFITGLYEASPGTQETCTKGTVANTASDICTEDGDSLQNFLYVFIAGNVLNGLGGTILYVIAPVYIDDNVMPHWTPVYLGIFYAFSSIGPAVGYIGGGAILDVYVDFDVVDTSTITLKTTDPRWVGAWWVGYLFISFFFLIIMLLLLCLGFETPDAAMVREERLKDPDHIVDQHGTSLKALPKSICSILKNGPFMFVTCAGIVASLASGGFSTFGAKFIQNQLNQSASNAALYAGAVLIPSATSAVLIGGILINRLKLQVKGMLKMCIIGLTMACLACGTFFVTCDQPTVAGVNVQYGDSSKALTETNLVGSCNSDCNCNTESRIPVCGIDGIEYFTPCHAGCDVEKLVDGTDKYWNCSCIIQNMAALGKTYDPSNAMAINEICATSCPYLPLFLVLIFIVVFGVILSNTPAMTTTLRVTPAKQRTLALSIQSIFYRFLGFVPGPILFSALIDNACIVWQETCGVTGSCWLYETSKMALSWFFGALTVLFICLLCFVFAHVTYKCQFEKKVGIVEGDENKKEESEKHENETDDEKRKKMFVIPNGLKNDEKKVEFENTETNA